MLRRYAQLHGIDFAPMSSGAPGYDPSSYDSPQGLLGKLLALQDEQAGKAFDSNPHNAPQQAVPERRLGRRTYRV